MFDIQKIYTNSSRYLCDYDCTSEDQAKFIVHSCSISVKECDFRADLYSKGNKVIVDTPNRELTAQICMLLNNSISALKS